MVNYLYDFDEETFSPTPGVLLADHFIRPYGFNGHRTSGTKDWLMIFTVSGEGHFRVNKQVQCCKAGDMVILPPGVPHHYATPRDLEWELMWVHFVPLPEWHVWLQLPQVEEKLIYFPIEDEPIQTRIKGAFGRLIQDSWNNDKSDQQLALIALSEVLALLHKLHVKTSGGMLDERIERIDRYLVEHLQDQHSVPQLADLAGLSVSRLCHLFKEQAGETIIERLNQMRMEKAVRLLEFTSRKIIDIAEEVGFESPYYFTRKFKQQFDKSPTDFRKQAQSKWLYRS